MADPKENKQEEVKQNPQTEQNKELDQKDLDKASGGWGNSSSSGI